LVGLDDLDATLDAVHCLNLLNGVGRYLAHRAQHGAVQAPRLVHGKPERAQPLTHPLDLLGRRIAAHDDDHRDDSSFSRGGAPAAWAATSARPSTPAASPLRAPTGSRQARGLPMVSVGLA